jgi:hypothetical protein
MYTVFTLQHVSTIYNQLNQFTLTFYFFCYYSPTLAMFTVFRGKIICVIYSIVTCMSVTIDGVWIGNCIYWTLTELNYK